MSISVSVLDAPTIYLTGTRILEDGSTVAEVALEVPVVYSTDTSITPFENIPFYMFSKSVTVTLSAPFGVPLWDYSGADIEDDTYKIGMLQDTNTEAKGNILYFFGPKMPAPTEAERYTGGFVVSRPPQVESEIPSGKHYIISDDIVTMFVNVFYEGKVGKSAAVKLKFV